MKIGFIGCGNMATAMIRGIVGSKKYKADDIIASDLNASNIENIKNELNINITCDNKEVAKNSDVLFLAIKPRFYEEVIEQIKDVVKEDVIIISITIGKSLEHLKSCFGREIKIIRTMPNTPAMVYEGMSAICPNELATSEDVDLIKDIFSSFSKTEIVAEYMIEAVVAVSGSSPAYVCMFIEALADGAVSEGMPRDMAYTFAAQAVLGTAKMVLESGMHPAKLKDMVCSPAGSTIEAVRVLEERGFRSSVIEAMKACAENA